MGSVISCNFKARLGVSDAPRRGDAPPPPSSWAPFPPWVVPAGAPALLQVAPGAPSPTQPVPCPQAPRPPQHPRSPQPQGPVSLGASGGCTSGHPPGGGGRGPRAAAPPARTHLLPAPPVSQQWGDWDGPLVRCATSPPRVQNVGKGAIHARGVGKGTFNTRSVGTGSPSAPRGPRSSQRLAGVPAPGPTELRGPHGAAGHGGALLHRPRPQRCQAPRGWDIAGARCPLSPGVPRGAGGAPHGRDPAALLPAQGTGDTPE